MSKAKPDNGPKLTPQQKAVITTKKKHGTDFYEKIGSEAGKKSPSAPFRDNPGLAKRAVEARWAKYRERKAMEAQLNGVEDNDKGIS
jgi:hypothetical protein